MESESLPWVGVFVAATAATRDSAGGARTDRLQTLWLEQFSEKFRRLRVLLEEMGTRFDSLGEEVMPPNTNRRPAVAGGWVLLGGRRPGEVNCRDEGAASLAVLWDRTGQQVFTVREVYEMLAAGTRYAESTVFKTMQRMKAPAGRAPWIVLEQTGAGFRISTQT